jgi:isopentenyl-diphosphate delta-isomerase
MGVGSQRRDLEVGSLVRAKTEWQVLREEAPEVVLFANLGLSQLIVTEVSRVRKLVEDLRAQALVIHTNALQEVLQPEGTPQFRGGIAALRRVCLELGYPVVLKETGCGFSAKTLQRLQGIGLAAIDVSGLGGTHWGRIEGARAECDSVRAAAAVTFANWGEPTASSVRSAVAALTGEKTEIWASGGVRSGLDAAKLIALGAHCVGYAKPALEAAWVSEKQLRSWMETQEFELKAALFCTGSESCQALRNQEGVWRKSVI